MPLIRPINAIQFKLPADRDLSMQIAPPYDVLDEKDKDELIAGGPNNIVEIDLPHLPPKTVGPDETYRRAGQMFRSWCDRGILTRCQRPALFAYRQTFSLPGQRVIHSRHGLFAAVAVQTFGPGSGQIGGIFAHEQTFSAPKQDRLNLMQATGVQLSPIFGLYDDLDGKVRSSLAIATEEPADFFGATAVDGVRHEVWTVDQIGPIKELTDMLMTKDIYIADGHHRYTTALTYRDLHVAKEAAGFCMFVLVAAQDPGMHVLATHRAVGGIPNMSNDELAAATENRIQITALAGSSDPLPRLAQLESHLGTLGRLAIGLYNPSDANPFAVITTTEPDPLAREYPDHPEFWRKLEVVICEHLIMGAIRHRFPDRKLRWQFPHALEDLAEKVPSGDFQLGLILQPTPLDAVMQVSKAGQLMPQKSTFFYPKMATGLVIGDLH